MGTLVQFDTALTPRAPKTKTIFYVVFDDGIRDLLGEGQLTKIDDLLMRFDCADGDVVWLVMEHVRAITRMTVVVKEKPAKQPEGELPEGV